MMVGIRDESSEDEGGRSHQISRTKVAKAGVAKSTTTTPATGKKRARDGTIKPISQTSRTEHKITPGPKPSDQQQDATQPTTEHRSLREKSQKLLTQRKNLPIWSQSSAIRQSLRGSKDVLLLVGETGSGKSTQVPQFLLDESWSRGKDGKGGCIAITQPRRVAAISLARRVAEEMGTPLGSASPASKVGYSVRFDNSVSPSTRIKFLTEGMLLQEMLRDPALKQYSAVIVDEVHERSVNVDLILGFLAGLLGEEGKKKRKERPLKVVVMSATADVQALSTFFTKSLSKADIEVKAIDVKSIGNGFNNSGTAVKSDKPVAEPDIVNDEYARKQSEDNVLSTRMSTLHIEGRQYPVKLTHLAAPTTDIVESALKAVFAIHTKEPLPGDILVFLTGQETVEALERLINEYGLLMDPTKKLPKILALPLFAALPQIAQQRVFLPAPPRTRKVIISTNIAETSVTVPGVRHVIDSGKMKVKKYRANLGLESLLVEPVSKSSAIQRQGRAGREAPGNCYRLYTEATFKTLETVTLPEILRCDLSAALLTMKARGINDVLNFPLLDAPPRAALEKALLHLLYLGAISPTDGSITKVGQQISRMPLSPTLGRVLIEASQPDKDCVADIIDVIACLSVENIFLNVVSEEKKEAAEESRRELLRREGDHMTLLATVRRYATENVDRKAWCERFFVSHRAMQNVMDIRRQLLQQARLLNLLPVGSSAEAAPPADITEQLSDAILRSLLAGFGHNTARLMPDGTYRTFVTNQQVAIHPSSVLFGRKVEAIVFTEWVWTTKSFGRGCSAIRLGWVEECFAEQDGVDVGIDDN